jgi:hypothetical protein
MCFERSNLSGPDSHARIGSDEALVRRPFRTVVVQGEEENLKRKFENMTF